jgi:RNA polymerase sigma factor for flagellar operon FliA
MDVEKSPKEGMFEADGGPDTEVSSTSSSTKEHWMPSTVTKNRPSTQQTLALWTKYRETSDPALRDRLILTFAPLVKFIVYRKVREMPARCEVEDFIGCGLEALIQSIDRYEPSKGATLEQYAWTRIHGAVLDELRRLDWAPRSVRRWERDMEKAVEEFTALHGRRPGNEELADAMGVSVPELRKRRDEIATSDLTSLNSLVLSDDNASIERIDTIASTDHTLDPELAAAKSQAKDKFRVAFARLGQREREVAVMLYVKNLTLSEIGEVLGVSESRVCQIHGQLKRTLKENLIEDAELFALVA